MFVQLRVAVGVWHLVVGLRNYQAASLTHSLDGGRQDVDLGAEAHGVVALARGVEKHHIRHVVVAEQNRHKTQAAWNVVQALAAAHPWPDEWRLKGDAFAIWDARMRVQHEQREFGDVLIGQAKQGLGGRKIARGNDSGVLGWQAGQQGCQLSFGDFAHDAYPRRLESAPSLSLALWVDCRGQNCGQARRKGFYESVGEVVVVAIDHHIADDWQALGLAAEHIIEVCNRD